jgi:putative ABC transport system permease protein
MFKNYIKIATRNILRQKEYSLLKILGLSIGIVSFILIFLFIRYHMSFDKYHENADRIFRVIQEDSMSASKTALTPNPLAPELAESVPEIAYAIRIHKIHRKILVGRQNRFFKEEHFFLTDPDVFRVFSFPLVKGNPLTVLREKFSVVISEEMAEKYFDNEDPVGKMLQVDDRFVFQITGVMKNIPKNSHFHGHFLASFAYADDFYWEGFSVDRTQSSLHTYLLLQKGASTSELESKLPAFIESFLYPVIKEYTPMLDQIPGGPDSMKFKLYLQPLTQIHLHSHLSAELSSNYDIRYIYILSVIALFVLITSCINFTNLTTAFSSRRFREIGMRKVLGAKRSQLIGQFVVESVVMAFISAILALIIIELLNPLFSSLLGENLSRQAYRSITVWPILVLLTLMVGIASGSYPAFFMSGLKPVKSLKGHLLPKSKRRFRSYLVVAQFVITISLIFSTLVISRQLDFLKNKQLGFQKEQIIVLSLEDRAEANKYPLIKNELLNHAHVFNVTGASNILSRVYSSSPFWWEEAQDDESLRMDKLFVDHDFIDTFGIKMVAGRNFSREIGADERNAFIINKTAARAFGWESPVGKKIARARRKKEWGTVIGVIEDFHFRSLHQKIEPLIILLGRSYFNNLCIKISQKDVPNTLFFIEQIWNKFFPGRPMEYFFLDDDIASMYKSERAMEKLFWSFSAIAIIIACLGLFGLISYATQQRTKEIGIRKVLGAGVLGIIAVLIKEFLLLLAISHLIAWPLVHYLMHNWLENFAYRANIPFLVHVLTAASTLIIALLTMSMRAVKAALANPADTLRYE